ncbi:hypothetical protein AcV7_001013 [Taiwanofungus camphoratus]|nr:hypothetical protein AcV7_001013 [Antrodia cinnamomea]
MAVPMSRECSTSSSNFSASPSFRTSPPPSYDNTPFTTPSHSYIRHTTANGGVDNDVIPPPSDCKPRTLVLCFDGTGDQFDADNSNVVLLFSMLKKDTPHEQLVYYQAGIGTYTIPQVATPVMANISKTLDEMIAWNLDAHVMGGYDFLMSNYEAGDKICLFGFSRGAYTARALAGMIHKVGLLPRCNHQQVPFAYKMFTRTDQIGWDQSKAFKKAFSMDVDIDFIGVWDTVCSVGLVPRTLPFTSSNTAIKIFRHALSLDEHRAKFKANHFNWVTEREHNLGVQPGDMPKSRVNKVAKPHAKKSLSEMERQMELQFLADEDHKNETDVLEVWFAGCHCDVGGGSVPNSSRHNLARIPLRWMIRQCFETNTGIRFHAELLKKVGLDPEALYPEVKKRPPAIYTMPLASYDQTDHNQDNSTPLTEEEEDAIDSLCTIYDQLKLAPYWWVLEVLPMEYRHQNRDREWENYIGVNLGRGRKVPKHLPFNIHRSVDIRLKAGKVLEGGPYKPNASWPSDLEYKLVD